jgi:ABC-type phosphate transport system substrate-binding protein
MIKMLASVLAIVLGALPEPALAQVSYVGSSTIGDHIIPAAAKTFTAKTKIAFGTIETQGSGKGLELVLRGQAPLAGVARSLTLAEKQRRIRDRGVRE